MFGLQGKRCGAMHTCGVDLAEKTYTVTKSKRKEVAIDSYAYPVVHDWHLIQS